MKHDLHVAGLAFGLRPITTDDADLVVELRAGNPRARFLNPIDPDPAKQRAWIEAYHRRPLEYQFAVVRQSDDRAEGFIGIYDVDPAEKSAVWGRWILRPESLAAVECVLRVFEAGFERLGLAEMRSQTVLANTAVVSFHDSCGLPRRRLLPAFFTTSDASHDGVEHVLTAVQWPLVKSALTQKAALVQRILSRK